MIRPPATIIAAHGLLLLAIAVVSGQGGPSPAYSAADVEAGNSLYQVNCASCHGTSGDQLPNVKVLSGIFTRPNLSDADLAAIITNGTPSELMPPTGLGQNQAMQVVAFMRARAAAASGAGGTAGTPEPSATVRSNSDATSERAIAGRAVFEASGCLTCHRIGNQGSLVGPDLTEIGAQRSAAHLTRSITEPDAEVLPTNRVYRVVTPDGTTILGRLLNHDSFTVQMIDTNNRLRSFVKASLRAAAVVPKSGMPSFQSKLSEQQLNDLVFYLSTKRGE